MSKVYFKSIDSYSETQKISRCARELLEKVIEKENVALEKNIPLKVHFGAKKNITFIESKNFEGIVDYIKENNIESSYIETNVIYSGSRMIREKHMEHAKAHGFTQLPVIIADGVRGEEYEDIEVGLKHFKKCKIATGMAEPKQMIVISHFKGHMLAGFGGAIKQLAMGCASRGGKLEQHVSSKPLIVPFRCKKCHVCQKHCPVDAIHIGFFSRIDKKKCIGCAACIAACPHKAIFFNPLKISLSKRFWEKIVEYAVAAQKGKKHIYISFAFNITKGCDCEGKEMLPVAGDIGVFASLDPVAIDAACMDLLDQREGKSVFKGRHTLDYAESVGLGSKEYELIEI